ncbi:hypothetical protein SOCEGT47_003250 [Sorangium cellulosum]|uniref:Uncharacterized protein n=1 Tax=Sorangium cellulosum TaxID=56 RepID=A0A4V0NCP3_SORCE|nr:hypothetical protein [Sorangium cellulosum]AUX19872.1 hypothetical protein SOCEGT47_003250 [Sorangium cellulosum]
MAKLTIGQKAERVLLLLLGLRKNKVAATLVAHGFSDDDLAEGWRLLQRVTRTRLGFVATAAATDSGLINELDAWENKWFPIASATLKRHAPEAHAFMFRNLGQTEGAAVLVSVSTFVERWENLARSKDKGGPDAGGEEGRKILARRGLTKAVIDEARELLARAGKLESVAEVAPAAAGDHDFEEAERQLWDWYLEWSTIVQTAIKDRRLLRELGFRRASSSRSSADAAAAEDEEAEEDTGGASHDDGADAEPAADPGAFLTGARPAAAARAGR